MHHRDELACGRAFQTERMACAETDAQAVQHGWEQGEARLGGGRDGTPKGHKWLTEQYVFQRGRETQEAGEQERVTDGFAHQRDH